MTLRRSDSLTDSLLHETVLLDWFTPMENALEKVRYSDAIFQSLPMASFCLLGGLRQLLALDTLRERVQMLFHWQETAEQVPVARSTWSDAMSSATRRTILRQAITQMVASAQAILPNKFAGLSGIGKRPILALDATYQAESSHYTRVLPAEGGNDNQKGHMLLTCYDIRHGIPVNVKTETASMGEMRVLKEEDDHAVDWSRCRDAIYVVDRAFIDARYWDERKKAISATVITRMKSVLGVHDQEDAQGLDIGRE